MLNLKRGIGIVIIFLIVVSYFVTFTVDSGANFETKDRLLGIIIFHNPFILAIYVIISIILIMNKSGEKRLNSSKKKKN